MPVCATFAKLFASVYSWQWQNWSISNLAAICQHCNRRYHLWMNPQIVATAGNLADTQTNVETILWEADSRTERLTVGLRGWQQDWETDSRTERLTAGLRGRQQDWEADSRTERLTVGLRGWQQDWEADRLCVLLPTASVQNKQENLLVYTKCICIYKHKNICLYIIEQ